MSQDWTMDVRKYAPNADTNVIAAIVRYCGIALQNRDASLVSLTDKAEVARVRENFLRKKLGLSNPDPELDQAIHEVGDKMKADRTKNRVTIYYLLAERFGKLSAFGGRAADAAAGAAERAGAAMAGGAEAMTLGAAGAGAGATAAITGLGSRATGVAERGGAAAAGRSSAGVLASGPAPRAGMMRWLPWLLVPLALLALWWVFGHKPATMTPPTVSAPTVSAPTVSVPTVSVPAVSMPTASAPAMTAPAAGAIASATAPVAAVGLPANVYFGVGSATVGRDGGRTLAATAEAIRKDGLKVALTGHTDRTGDAAINARLARSRMVAVRDALTQAGVPAASIELSPPASVEIGAVGKADANARRVEIARR